jgi:hypothetical protein
VQSYLGARKVWFIASRCPRTIDQLRNLRWADNFTPEGEKRNTEKVVKRNDELSDCVRYDINTCPELPEHDAAPSHGLRDLKSVPETSRWQVDRMRRLNKRDDDDFEDEGDFEDGLASEDFEANPMGDFWA